MPNGRAVSAAAVLAGHPGPPGVQEGLADAGTARAVLKEEDELQDEVDRVAYLLNKRLECCSEGREALSRPAELGSKNRSDYALKS